MTKLPEETAKPVTIDGLVEEIHEWQLKTFPHATAKSKARHLLKEARELWKKPEDGSEMADCLMLLIGIAKIQDANLALELKKKFEENKARDWGAPDKYGVVQHVKPGGEVPDAQRFTLGEMGRRHHDACRDLQAFLSIIMDDHEVPPLPVILWWPLETFNEVEQWAGSVYESGMWGDPSSQPNPRAPSLNRPKALPEIPPPAFDERED